MTVTTFSAREVDINEVHAWPDNPRPRTQFTAESLADILPSIQSVGIIEPIVLRTRPKGGGFWIVAGERRYQSAKLAGLAVVPATFREVGDAEALQLALTENTKRKNLHPMEEGLAYERLGVMDPAYRDLKALAAFVSQPVSHVRRRLKLAQLGPVARAAFTADAITAAHAERIAGVDPKDQAEALEHCFGWLAGNTAKLIKAGDWKALAPALNRVDDLDRWIRDNVALDTKDETVQQELIEGLLEERATVVTPEVLMTCVKVSEQHYAQLATTKKLGVIPMDKWVEVNPARLCEYATPALVAHGGPRRLLHVCVEPKCKQHLGKPKPKAPSAPAGGTSAKKMAPKALTPAQQKAHDIEVARQAEEQFEVRVWEMAEPRIIAALAARLGKLPVGVVHIKTAIEASGENKLPSVAEVEKRCKVKIGKHAGLYFGLCGLFEAATERETFIAAVEHVIDALNFKLKPIEDAARAEIKAADAKKAKK